MNLILFYDTETTGLPDWQAPSDAEHQPHLVQLAAILADADTREEVSSIDLIVRPGDWDVPAEVSEIHGITFEHAMKCGVDEKTAVDVFSDLFLRTGDRVAHNKVFDQRIMRIAFKRYEKEALTDLWADKDSHLCTMRMYQDQFGGKRIKLVDAYKDATGKELENAHSALADTRACMEVYWWLLDQNQSQNPFDIKGTANVSQ